MRYGDKVAVAGLSLDVARGSITAVLGPNGAGKTTTLETCEGYRKPHQGTVRVLGLDPMHDRAALLPRIGVMLQGGGAWSGVRAVEMLDHMAALHRDPLDTIVLAERLGLEDCGKTPYRRLSGGQKQRLALAVALVGRPELVFVDEPTAGMDPVARRTTWELLEEVRRDGVTVVLTTHYLEEAERLADQIHIIDQGRLIASGAPADLTRDAGSSTVRLVVAATADDGALGALCAALGTDATFERSGDQVVVEGSADPATLATITKWCEQQHLDPISLQLGRRTLEDVFLELTRREDA